jgi:ABC-2 type transport system permease protein
VTAVARIIWSGWLLQLKEMHRSGLFVFTAVIQPLILATLVHYLFVAGHRPQFDFHPGLGAGMMGLWSATLYGAATVITRQRRAGTLEYLVGTPPPLFVIIVPLTLAGATIGVYSLGGAVLWTKVAFGVPFDPVHSAWFVLAFVVTLFALGTLGLLMASSFVLVYRNATVFANFLEIPFWMMSGALVPVTALPGGLEQIAQCFPPTWGFRAMRDSVFGGEPLMAIGVCLVLSVPFLLLGIACSRVLERRARARAALSLV